MSEPEEHHLERAEGPIPAWIGTPQHLRWLRGLAAVTLVLNGLDAILTMIWVYLGLAKEGNPLMEILVTDAPVAFVLAKVTLVSLGLLLLWRYRNRPLAVLGLFVAFGAYYGIALIHAGGIGKLIERWRNPPRMMQVVSRQRVMTDGGVIELSPPNR